MIARKDVGLVGGETAAGLLISWIEDPQTLTKEIDEDYTTMRLKGSLWYDSYYTHVDSLPNTSIVFIVPPTT